MSSSLASMPKYGAYKDSGVEWLGCVPEYWALIRLKFVVKEHAGNGFPVEEQGSDLGDVPFYKVSDISGHAVYVSKASNYVSHRTIKKLKWNLVPSGSIITAKIGEALRKNHRKISTVDAVIDNNCIAFEATDIDLKYNYYLHRVIDFDWFTNPGAVPSISVPKYKSLNVALPPLNEQTAIAAFLDRKTAQIDQAVAIKEQQIALLKERKQILIQNAVTRGLDPHAPMRDTGVEWIGEIPAHWEVLPGLRFLSENKRSNKGMVESQVLSLSYGKIVIKPEEKLVGLVPESFETYQIVKPGDIIVRCTDLQNDKTSLRTGIAKDNGIITSAYLNLSVHEDNNPEYIHYFLHVIDITKVIYKYGSGLRQNLSYADFKRMPVLSVPIDEQNDIVNFIEEETAKTDKAIDLQQQQIDRLKEYKATLINSAVTGKIKVPGVEEHTHDTEVA